MERWLFVLCAFLHPVLGVLLAGGGHGWVTGMFFSFLSTIALIFLTIFGSKNKLFGFFLIAGNIASTMWMLFETKAEGVTYFLGVWNSVSAWVMLYLLLWFSWLAMPIISFLRNRTVK